jgi:hypothetical protein
MHPSHLVTRQSHKPLVDGLGGVSALLGYQSGDCEAHGTASGRRWSFWQRDRDNDRRRGRQNCGLKCKILVLGFVAAELAARVLQAGRPRQVVSMADTKDIVFGPVTPPSVGQRLVLLWRGVDDPAQIAAWCIFRVAFSGFVPRDSLGAGTRLAHGRDDFRCDLHFNSFLANALYFSGAE